MTLAELVMVRAGGRYAVTPELVHASGGRWNDEVAQYDFLDGSAGAFTDLSGNTSERRLTGEPLTHWYVVESVDD